jgi:hypothetical protein
MIMIEAASREASVGLTSTKVFAQVIRSIVSDFNRMSPSLADSGMGHVFTDVVTYYPQLLQIFNRIALTVIDKILLIL